MFTLLLGVCAGWYLNEVYHDRTSVVTSVVKGFLVTLKDSFMKKSKDNSDKD